MPLPWLADLERSLASNDQSLEVAVVILAAAGGADVHIQEDEAHGASRRALLLLAAGGDPERGLDLNGPAVSSLADDLRSVDRQLALEQGLADLRVQAAGLPHVSEALHGLTEAPDVAWRAYAAALLAEELGGGD